MLFPLAGRTAYLKLTTSHYYLPLGKCIHREENSTEWGVDPDLTIEMTPEQMRAAIDARQDLDVLRDADVPLRLRTDSAPEVPVPRPREAGPRSEMPKGELDVLLEGAAELLDLDDCTGALELLRKARALAPADARVAALLARGERTLMAMLESKLGDTRNAPRLKLQPDEIIWLNLDHRAGFVLAQIDGQVSYEDLFALSGMPRLDTARILVQLLDEGVIEAAATGAAAG